MLVTHGEFNTSVDCPDLWQGYFLMNTELSFKWTPVGKGLYFKQHSKISIMPKPNLFQSECSLHTLKEHIRLSSRHTQFATLLWTRNNLLTTVVADCSGLQYLALQCSRLWYTCQDFCGIIFLFSLQKFTSDFLPQVILFQASTSLWICYQQLSCYGQPKCQLLSSPNSKQNTAVKISPLCRRCNFTQAV